MSYAEKQAEFIKRCNIKLETKVKVIRKATSRENGWATVWMRGMDDAVGHVGVVKSSNPTHGFELYFENGSIGSHYFYPYFVLKRVL